MREILFRGKSKIKSAWWTGFYIYSSYDQKHYIVQNSTKSGNRNQFVNFAHFAEVDPSTIGQYTGKRDKNGAHIFEGDIMNCDKFEDDFLFIEYCPKWEGYLLKKEDKVHSKPTRAAFATYGALSTSDSEDLRILGNMHDNPNLITINLIHDNPEMLENK